MNSFSMMLSLFVLFFVSSCQVKDSSPSGGLISGHKPATNSFTLEAPAAKNYTTGDVVTLVYSFPYDIIMDTTSGSPRLSLTIGGDSRYANLVDQPTPKKLRFSYTIQASEEDTDGIDINALELNGSTLKFDDRGTLTNCNVGSVVLTNLANQKVDAVIPTISGFDFQSLPGHYREGDIVHFKMTFSESVIVTGTPFFQADIGNNTVDFKYSSGSGTKELIFSYKVTINDAGANGQFDSISNDIELGTGSIKDATGNDADLTLDALKVSAARAATAVIRIIGDSPYVVGVTVPSAGTYLAGATLEVVLEFNREVNVSNSPYIALTIGSNSRNATYTSVSGKFVTFSYTLIPGDVATGITVASSITGGTIGNKSAPVGKTFFNSFTIGGKTYNNNSFVVPDTSGVIINAVQPAAISVIRNNDDTNAAWGTPAQDNKWIIGQPLDITINFNTTLKVTQTDGVPTIDLTFDNKTVSVPYLSGDGQSSLIFRYTIQEGDEDDDGNIGISSIKLNDGVITDLYGTNITLALPVAQLTNTKIDGIRPFITSVSKPIDRTYSVASTVPIMNFTVNWNEPVRYTSGTIPMDVGGTNVPLYYAAGTNTAAITHRPNGGSGNDNSGLSGKNDNNGVAVTPTLTATVTDQAGNAPAPAGLTFPALTTTGILVDTTNPGVSSVVPVNANGTYKAGQSLVFTVTFTEPVTILRDANYPRIPITIGSKATYLKATQDKMDTIHTFSYTIVDDDFDDDGVLVGTTLENNGTTAYARDLGDNLVTGTFTPQATSGIKVDAQVPTIITPTGSGAKAYVSGEKISVTLKFSEKVKVTGNPKIDLDFTDGTDDLIYVSGSESDTLVFERTLDGDHFDMNGLHSVNSVNLNGGSITDEVGNDTEPSFSLLDLSSYYVTYPEVTVWVKNDFINLAPSATATPISSGNNELDITGAMNGVRSILTYLRTPYETNDTYDFFEGNIKFIGKPLDFNFDMETANASINGSGFNTIHDKNLSGVNFYKFNVYFLALQNYATPGPMIPTNFYLYGGLMKETIIIKNGLLSTELAKVEAYFNGLP